MVRATRIRACIDFAHRDKAWLLATGIVVAALSFLATFVASIPRARVDDDAAVANLLAEHSEVETTRRITERASGAVSAYYDVMERFDKDIDEAADSRHLTTAWFDESFRQLTDARNKANVTAGVFHGTRLSDSTLEAHRIEVITNLERMDTTLGLIERYYVNLRTCGAQLKDAPQKLKAEFTQSEAITNRQRSAFDGWGAAASAFIKRHQIGSARREVDRQQHRGKAILAFLSLGSILIYVSWLSESSHDSSQLADDELRLDDVTTSLQDVMCVALAHCLADSRLRWLPSG